MQEKDGVEIGVRARGSRGGCDLYCQEASMTPLWAPGYDRRLELVSWSDFMHIPKLYLPELEVPRNGEHIKVKPDLRGGRYFKTVTTYDSEPGWGEAEGSYMQYFTDTWIQPNRSTIPLLRNCFSV